MSSEQEIEVAASAEKRKSDDDSAPAEDSSKKLKPDVKEEQGAAAGEGNEYSYTKTGEFTSEVFKIKVTGLPKNFGFAEIRKRLDKDIGVTPHKIKINIDKSAVYVCFKNDDQKARALEKVNGHVWKGCTLKAEGAWPAPDPYYAARQKMENREINMKKKRTAKQIQEDKEREELRSLSKEAAHIKLKDCVTPLWRLDYAEQLEEKTNDCKEILKKIVTNHFIRGLPDYRDKTKNEGMACPLLKIVPSPVIKGYRNKNEFTIGEELDGKTLTIGFRYGLYKSGVTSVGSAECVNVADPRAEQIAACFKTFVERVGYETYKYQRAEGHWQTLMIRTFSTGDVMVFLEFIKGNLGEEEMDKLKVELKNFCTETEGKDLNIKSFFLRLKGIPKGEQDKFLIYGDNYVYESILGCRFRISPEAFFQVNSKGTEVMYQIVHDWCQLNKETTILDVCCGTGTIGLSMAKKVKEVIGIDFCEAAIEDAKANAELNGISNATFYCSKVEDIIAKIMTSFPPTADKNLVAVVDPPRAGVCKTVVKCLRKHKGIQRLVYISCKPEFCMDNFVDFIRLPTNNMPGIPFKITQAVPMDLFPGAKHCEMVFLFERDTSVKA